MPATGHDCPKCFYDLTGEQQSWTDACPLCGTCPECGFEFDWGELLVGTRTRPVPVQHSARISGKWGCLLLGFAVIALLTVALLIQ